MGMYFRDISGTSNPLLKQLYFQYDEEDIVGRNTDIVKVVFNKPATIVWFADGDKVIVKAYDEDFDKEKGVAMAVMRKLYGTRAYFNKVMENAIDQNKDEKVENVAINIQDNMKKEHKCSGNCGNCK